MGAPTASVRTDPTASNIHLEDGHPTKVSIEGYLALAIWESDTTPPAMEGGDPIDLTTFFNSAWRTSVPRNLKSLEPITVVGLYDPVMYETGDENGVYDIINVNKVITVTFSDTSTIAFWGYVRSFTPGNHVEGTAPTATVIIQPTMRDDAGVEQDPVVEPVTGT